MSDTVAQDTLGDQNPGGNNSLNRVRRQQLIHATIRIFTKHHSPFNSHGVNKLISRTDYVTGHKVTQDAHRIRIRIRRFQSKFFLRTALGCEVILTLTICPLNAASGYEFLCLATVNIGTQIHFGIIGFEVWTTFKVPSSSQLLFIKSFYRTVLRVSTFE